MTEREKLYALNGNAPKVMPEKLSRIVRKAYSKEYKSPIIRKFLFSLWNSGWSIELRSIRAEINAD